MVNRKILVLNQSWIPICLASLKSAIRLLFPIKEHEPKAKIADANFQTYTWNEWIQIKTSEDDEVIKTPHSKIKLPKIIILTQYNKIHQIKIPFNRKNLLKRDTFCQYCGKIPLVVTVDHIIPKCLNGETSWTNCVIACATCNSKKGHKLLKESGLILLKTPEEPSLNNFLKEYILFLT